MNQHPGVIYDTAQTVRLLTQLVENFKICQKTCHDEYNDLHDRVAEDLFSLICVLRDILDRAKLLTEEQRKTLDKLTDGGPDD